MKLGGGVLLGTEPATSEIPSIGAENANASRVAPERVTADAKPASQRFAFGADHAGDALERWAGRLQPRSLAQLDTAMPHALEQIIPNHARQQPVQARSAAGR